MSETLTSAPSEGLSKSGSGCDFYIKVFGVLFDALPLTGSKYQWLSVFKRDDGSLYLCDGEPESGNPIAYVANPNYGLSKDDTVNVAVKLAVTNYKDFSSFDIKGSNVLWTLLRIQNGQSKAYNALFCAVRKNEPNPNCNEFEAAIHGLKEALLLKESKDVKIALGDLKFVFEY